ncbi:MAG: serine/threonine protein kinase [Deltaproteobacteria bacterium]|nr:serine/threonine protein kinase [Deltaproteobacteria bacterium]
MARVDEDVEVRASSARTYVLGPRIQSGSHAEVHRGRATGSSFERGVALKLLRTELARSEDARRRFEREARILSQLSHSAIVTILDFTEVAGRPCQILELIDGDSLRGLLVRAHTAGVALPAEAAIHVISELAGALEYLNQVQGPTGDRLRVVHRDVKPENVLISFHGEVKIIDFGIATCADGVERTSVGMSRGTPEYMAPEQAKSDVADHRSDLFSLGCMLHELLAGDSPIADARVRDAMLAGSTCPVDPRLDRAIAQVVARATRVDPAARYSSAHELGEALGSCALARPAAGRFSLVSWISQVVATDRTFVKTPGMPFDLGALLPDAQLTPERPATAVLPAAHNRKTPDFQEPPITVRGGAPRLEDAKPPVAPPRKLQAVFDPPRDPTHRILERVPGAEHTQLTQRATRPGEDAHDATLVTDRVHETTQAAHDSTQVGFGTEETTRTVEEREAHGRAPTKAVRTLAMAAAIAVVVALSTTAILSLARQSLDMEDPGESAAQPITARSAPSDKTVDGRGERSAGASLAARTATEAVSGAPRAPEPTLGPVEADVPSKVKRHRRDRAEVAADAAKLAGLEAEMRRTIQAEGLSLPEAKRANPTSFREWERCFESRDLDCARTAQARFLDGVKSQPIDAGQLKTQLNTLRGRLGALVAKVPTAELEPLDRAYLDLRAALDREKTRPGLARVRAQLKSLATRIDAIER